MPAAMIWPTLMMALLAAAPQAAPSLASIDGLPPDRAGDILLSGREHGIVESVRVRPVLGLEPPGLIRRELLERTVQRPDGCVRRRWTTNFTRPPGAAEDAAVLSGAHSETEVALARPAGCPDGAFAQVNGGMDAAQALAALERLDDIAQGRIVVEFTCVDRAGTGLCEKGATLARELAKLPPWAVMRRGARTELWLGAPGQLVTRVSYAQDQPGGVAVEREIPAPF